MNIAIDKQVIYAIHLGWHYQMLPGGFSREAFEWMEMYMSERGARTAAKNWIEAWTADGDLTTSHFIRLVRFDRSSQTEKIL